jgi:Tfp pilus assembly protein PilX
MPEERCGAMKKQNVSRNQSGAALLWAVMSVMMVALLAAGLVVLGRTYYMRERNENNRVQAELYAQSAIDLIQADIVAKGENSAYVSDNNTTETVTVAFPDVTNWTCVVSIHHSQANVSATDSSQAKKSGVIYLTATVTRSAASGSAIELSEVCAKLVYKSSSGWTFAGYYNL